MQQAVGTSRVRNDALVRGMDSWHQRACRAQRNLLSLVVEADEYQIWKQDGARDMAHWLWMRYGLSEWKARRWIVAAHALRSLPLIDEAFTSGALGVDKVVELCRFATPETEETLLAWARRASAGAIRARGGPGGAPRPRAGRADRAGPVPAVVARGRWPEPAPGGAGCPRRPARWSSRPWSGRRRGSRSPRMGTPGRPRRPAGPTPWWPSRRHASRPIPTPTAPRWSSTSPWTRSQASARTPTSRGPRSRAAGCSTPRPPGDSPAPHGSRP